MNNILSLQALDSVIIADGGCSDSKVSCTSEVSCKSTVSSIAGT